MAIFVLIFHLLFASSWANDEKCDSSNHAGGHTSCRWDKKTYYNTDPALTQPMAHVCNAMAVAMAVEFAYSMHDKQRYDISIQAILDCFVPDRCFPNEVSRHGSGCAAKEILEKMYEKEHEHKAHHAAFGIFLKKTDYPRQFNHLDTQQHPCQALNAGLPAKWAKRGVTYELLDHELSKTAQKKGRIAFKPTIQELMVELRKSPVIIITKTTHNLANYQLHNANHVEDLAHAYDADNDHSAELPSRHAFFVIGYVKPKDHPYVYLLVKTCKTGAPWGWNGKGFIKATTSDVLDINEQVYVVKTTDVVP